MTHLPSVTEAKLLDRATNRGGKETETGRTTPKNGGKTREKGRGRSTRKQSE